jgi:hypothetical protein
MSTSTDVNPYRDMPATWNAATDAHPCTVIAVSKSGKSITIQDDDYEVVSGSEHDGTAQYTYTRNPKGLIQGATRRKNGVFRLKGSCRGYGCVNLGFRRRYYDPSF